jgi:hypothetical protein
LPVEIRALLDLLIGQSVQVETVALQARDHDSFEFRFGVVVGGVSRVRFDFRRQIVVDVGEDLLLAENHAVLHLVLREGGGEGFGGG